MIDEYSKPNSESNENPLVSFILLAYNQEKYIEEAIEGAFSQSYSPLQIIISDDHSEDKTFNIIKQKVRNYQGQHYVLFRKTDYNKGISSHLNEVVKIANGELIILAAGDDISCPSRTCETVKKWLQTEKKCDSIWSAVELIDSGGSYLGIQNKPPIQLSLEDQIRKLAPSVLGCSHALTKRLFEKFGCLNSNVVYEDRVISFRSWLSGGYGYIETPLVKYRIHSQSISNNDTRALNNKNIKSLHQNYLNKLDRTKVVLIQYAKDINNSNDIKCGDLGSAMHCIANQIIIIDHEMRLLTGKFHIRLKSLAILILLSECTIRTITRWFMAAISPSLLFQLIMLKRKYEIFYLKSA